jgi:hypothetical protein
LTAYYVRLILVLAADCVVGLGIGSKLCLEDCVLTADPVREIVC